MKKRLVYVHHHRGLPNGPHLRYFVMTIAVAVLLAIGILVMSVIIGKEFFNL